MESDQFTKYNALKAVLSRIQRALESDTESDVSQWPPALSVDRAKQLLRDRLGTEDSAGKSGNDINTADVQSSTFALAAKSRPNAVDTVSENADARREAIPLTGGASGAELVLQRGAVVVAGVPASSPKRLAVGDRTFELQSTHRQNEYLVLGMSKGVVARLVREGGGSIAARFE